MTQHLHTGLKETPALWPFVGQFIALALIAGWTRQNNVRNVVGRDISTDSAAKRVSMFNVIDVLPIDFGEFGKATSSIVASMVLKFEQFFDLFDGICSACASSHRVSLPVPRKNSLVILFSVLRSVQFCLFFMCAVIFAGSFVSFFGVSASVFLVVLRSLLIVLLSMGFCTFFTSMTKPAFAAFISVKVLRGSRVPFFTICGGALFQGYIGWYNGVHDKGQLLVITPLADCNLRRGKTLLPPHFTINPHFEQLEEVFA